MLKTRIEKRYISGKDLYFIDYYDNRWGGTWKNWGSSKNYDQALKTVIKLRENK